MDIAIGALIGGLVWTLTSFIRRITARDWIGVKNQSLTYGVGVVAVVLAANADLTDGYTFNGVALGDLNAFSLVILGLMVTSLFAMVPYDLTKAIDNTQSARVPNLLEDVHAAKVPTPPR